MKKRYRSLERLGLKQKVLIFSLVMFFISGAFAVVAQIFAAQLFGWSSTVYRTQAEFEFKPYLEFNVTNIPLNVSVYDGDEIKIEYVNETPLIIEKREYSYVFSQNPDFAFSLFAAEQLNYRLNVFLPDKTYHEISVSTASGKVSFAGAFTEELYISGRSSDIDVRDAKGEVTVKTFSGSIHAGFSEFEGDSYFESASGGIIITVSEGCEFNLDFGTDTGLFYTDFFPEYEDVNKTRTAPRDGKLSVSKGYSANTLKIRTESGNLSLIAEQAASSS